MKAVLGGWGQGFAATLLTAGDAPVGDAPACPTAAPLHPFRGTAAAGL